MSSSPFEDKQLHKTDIKFPQNSFTKPISSCGKKTELATASNQCFVRILTDIYFCLFASNHCQSHGVREGEDFKRLKVYITDRLA